MKTLLSEGAIEQTEDRPKPRLFHASMVDTAKSLGDSTKTTILAMQDIRGIVEHVGLDTLMDGMIARLMTSFRDFEEKKTVIPMREGFTYDSPNIGLLEWMPVMEVGKMITVKLVGYHPLNPKHNDLPTILSTVFVFDSSSGHLSGIADGTFLTALRTGAASAIASQIMANPNAKIVGLIGCGAQAVTQLHAISRTFEIEKALIYDLDSSAMKSFSARVSSVGLNRLDIRVSSLSDLVKSSDIICTCTTVGVGEGPLFEEIELKPWAHINAVGSDFPGKIELPAALLKQSFVCPDFTEQAVREGECQQLAKEEIGPDIVELVKNRKKYESTQQQISIFDSTGWAFEDHIAMEVFMGYANELGVGRAIEIESTSNDPKNPYQFLKQHCFSSLRTG